MRIRVALVALVALTTSALTACDARRPDAPGLETVERTLGTGDGPFLVLLHGYGSRPEHLVGFASRTDLPPGTHLVLPRAPLPAPGSEAGGAMWWELPANFRDLRQTPMAGMETAGERVASLLDRLSAMDSTRPIVLGGFSQGAMLSLFVALRDPRPLAGLVLLSGTLVDERETVARLDRRRGLPVFVSHGMADGVLAYAHDAELVSHMRTHGLDVRLTTFEGGHVVTPEVSTGLAGFVREVAARP